MDKGIYVCFEELEYKYQIHGLEKKKFYIDELQIIVNLLNIKIVHVDRSNLICFTMGNKNVPICSILINMELDHQRYDIIYYGEQEIETYSSFYGALWKIKNIITNSVEL